MTKTATKRPAAKRQTAGTDNGNLLAQAIEHEEAIRVEAETIRGDATYVDDDLFLKLWPLLRRPIPSGFIVSVASTGGKPYDSTGVKSAQVLIDRMDNVLGPLSWTWRADHSDDGTLCKVTVSVGSPPFVERSSWGGVDRGSTKGNVYKGSETNAAKRAFAAIGPGHEIYVGAADLDPDTHQGVAEAQAVPDGPVAPRLLPADAADRLMKAIDKAGLKDDLPAKLRSFGVDELTALSVEQGIQLHEWTGGHLTNG